MANRKVLINRHTSGNTVPVAADMYKGEIAVQHKTGEEILWTKNNDDVMVPFISCAQTMTMINNAISGADVTYDVKAANGDAHVEVVSGGTEKAKVFTVSSKDVQSKAAFDTYSAATDATIKANYNTLSGAIDDVLSIITTSITGDSIIKVQPTTSGAGAYNLSHKEATAVTGFNKLSTDAYGHVTASTAVVASDIKTLGFEDSAWTEQKITDAIEALDSAISASSAGKYFTALAIENGKLVAKEEASIPVLEVESAGTGNVVEAITVNGHKISYTTTSVATSHDIEELSAATINLSGVVGNFSAATDTKFRELSAYTEDVDNKVIALSSATVAEFTSAFTAIQGMDKAADAVAGQIVTTVSQEDGKVTETKANVKDLQLGGYSKDTTATGAIAATDTINTALSKLENIVAANEISNADGSIVVTEPAGTATTTDVKVNIKSGEKVIKLDGEGGGLYTNLNLVKITESLPATVKERYEFRDSDNNKIGESIDIAKDSHIVSITYNEATQKLIYTYLDASGATQTAEVDMAHLILETEVENGIQSVNGKLSIKLDTTGDDTGDGKFLTVGENGLKLDGVTDAINAAIESLDVTGDTAVAGQYVAAIEETDGVVAVKTRANVSEAVLNGYTKGSDAAAVAATDTVNQAISKLENQVDAAKAATTKVVEGTDAGNNMTIASTTSDTDGSVTYTVNLTDVASKAALDAEIAARKAVDGQNGDAYAANAGTNFISDATSLNDADVKLDTAIKTLSGNAHDAMIARDNVVFSSANTYTDEQIDEVYASGVSYTDDKVAAEIALLDSVGSASTTGHYLTSVTITDGKISAVGEVAVPAAVAITATTAAPSDAASAVLTGITADGKDNHNLTFGMSNKVFSASTADEAVKVKNALSISGYASSESTALDNAVNYDGSAAQSITFGKDTAAGKSMSFNGGVVDVEIIDCGEY